MITVKMDGSKKLVALESIPIGTTFTGTIDNHSGLFLVTYDNVVYLNSPISTWSRHSDVPSVWDFQPVDIVIEVLLKK